MTSAIVHTPFKGCDDGTVHPRQIAKGETVHGDLARAAIAGGFAEEIGSGDAPQPSTAAAAGEAIAEGEGVAEGDAEPQSNAEPKTNAAPTNKARKSAPAKK